MKEERQTGPVKWAEGAEPRIADRLRALNVPVVPFFVDVAAYRRYRDAAAYERYHGGYYPSNIAEKSLEHFLASQFLSLSPAERYVDIASEHSPVPEVYARLHGCRTYRQDLTFPPGLNGDTIGSDAANMPVPDGFATRLGLHCSFEHFEGDADSRFLREAARVLAPGGRVCIVPFYVAEHYAIQTDPAADSRGVVFDAGAVIHEAPAWGNRFGRVYDPEHVATRLLSAGSGLDLTVYQIMNATDVDASCYARFALVLSRPS